VHGDNQMSWMTQRTDGGTVFVQAGGPFESAKAGDVLPQVTLAVEHYNRILRIMEKGIPVKVELNIAASFRDEAPGHENGFNVIGEIPGTDLANEVVMVGAHLDSHQSATGATDNAAGVAAMMEAMRILQAVGAKPRRTIRIALWGGEEEGELGSQAYIRSHFYNTATHVALPEYKTLSAYYNLDNGTGRIRGVWIQGNFAAQPIFRSWFPMLKDLGVNAIAPRSVAGSDYSSFDDVGLPGFQFMQDRLEYNSRTHHSNMDTVDRLQRDDLTQMAIVAATFAYNTAMRQEMIPRKVFVPEPRKEASTR
jgi:carboxypeptidase Q